MADSKLLGSGAASKAAEAITRRSNKVDRAVEQSVRGVAQRASRENERGQRRGTTAESARKTERKGKKGERAFGAPL